MGLDMRIEKRYYGGSDELFYCSKESEINEWFIKQYLKNNSNLTLEEVYDRGYSPNIVVTKDMIIELVNLLLKNKIGYNKGNREYYCKDLIAILEEIENNNDITYSSDW